MKPIEEQQVDWSVLSNTLELVLPLKAEDYPVRVQLFDASKILIQEMVFQQKPVLLKKNFPSGKYHYIVLKNELCLFSDTITL
jgi:hypothetical protein